MEVGAVKQAFNNELILLKKNLNQAKIQIIHKLTRRAKTLIDKKAPEHIKEKLKRKSESAIKEVLIIKKIKPKDVAKFTITHTNELKKYLNKPEVDNDKACARLLLHKALQDKYKFIRGRFANVPIKDLFMSRIERRKMKKEAKEQQKNKKKGKDFNTVNSESDWNVEDIKGDEENGSGNDEQNSDMNEDLENVCDSSETESEKSKTSIESDIDLNDQHDDDIENEAEIPEEGQFVKIKTTDKSDSPFKIKVNKDKPADIVIESKPNLKEIKNVKSEQKTMQNKMKDVNKKKNFNEKLKQRKFKKKTDDIPVTETKIVDPFFITSTGESYMSVVEPRQPDEFKEEHHQGNRKYRRAVMFGHVPKIKPRDKNTKFNNKRNILDEGRFGNKNNYRNDQFSSRKSEFDNRNISFKGQNVNTEVKDEKLHPSWEAKKRQSGILPFKGKKVVFDES